MEIRVLETQFIEAISFLVPEGEQDLQMSRYTPHPASKDKAGVSNYFVPGPGRSEEPQAKNSCS
jgi:hypothetical protein